MSPDKHTLGVMRPVGGGDPIPLRKPTAIIGRRKSCDVCLDFTNVSGKHCELRLVNGVWRVRDMGSTNGTTLNGSPLTGDHSLLPDDELGIASHLFHLDYEPSGPEAALHSKGLIEPETVEQKRGSLMELAGIGNDEDVDRPRQRPRKPPDSIERVSVDEAGFDDALPDHVQAAPVETSDSEFLKLIEDSVVKKPE